MSQVSRRFDDAPRVIARLQRQVDDLWKLASRKGHGHVLGYAEVTSSQTGITTETDLTGLSVTVSVGESRRIRISSQITLVGDGTASQRGALRIKESTTELQRARGIVGTASAELVVTITSGVVLTPSSGSHTYKLTLEPEVGGTEVASAAAASIPAFVLVEDIGPA